MSKVLVGYATKYGSTREVAEAIKKELEKKNFNPDLKPVSEVNSLNGYKSIVLGAPLMMGHFHKDMHRFLTRYKEDLSKKPVAFYALGPVSVPYSEKEWQGSRSQLKKELDKYAWFKPFKTEVLGGKFDPANLPFPINKLASKAPVSDTRDWKKIKDWTNELMPKLK